MFRFRVLGFRAEGLGFRFGVLGFRAEGLVFRFGVLGFRAEGLGFRFGVLGFRAEGLNPKPQTLHPEMWLIVAPLPCPRAKPRHATSNLKL